MIVRGKCLGRLVSKAVSLFSRPISVILAKSFATTTNLLQNSKDDSTEATIPWYMREENSSPVEVLNKIEVPELPENSPQSLQEFVTLLTVEYGLTDLEIFDLSQLPEDHPKSLEEQNEENYVILASGKSEKHIYKAAYELRLYIKHTYKHLPIIEGMSSNSISKVTRRRLAKRVRRGPPATASTFGIGANSWVSCGTGVDGIVIHLLSRERRESLNLEQFYSDEQENEESHSTPEIDQDRLFFGDRRGFHTSSRNFNLNTLSNIYDSYVIDGNFDTSQKFKAQFDLNFKGGSVEEHNKKFELYRAINLVNANVVEANEIEQIIWDKYSSLDLALQQEIDWNTEIIKDTIKYMEFLVDLNARHSPREKLDKLSGFISNITCFAGDSIDLFTIDKFGALLWRLTWVSENNNALDSANLNEIIKRKGDFEPGTNTILFDNELGRNIRELLRQNKYSSNKETFPLWLREQMMYTFGQAGLWDRFWRDWQSILQSLNKTNERIYFWVVTALFLSKVDNRDALRHLFTKYWSNPSGASFVADYTTNNHQFNSDNERMALKSVLVQIGEKYNTSPWAREAAQFADNL